MKFRNIILFILTASLVSGAVLYSCTRKKVDYLGPEYLSAPAGFTASNFVVNSPDFTTGTCTVTADFSARVTYYLTFTGLSSGAVKSFTGVDSKIDASSVGNTWNGSHDGLYFFRTGEQVEAKLTFLRSEYTISQIITITAARNYFAGNPNIIPIPPINNASNNNTYDGTGVYPYEFSFGTAKNDQYKHVGPFAASTLGIKAIDGLRVFRIAGHSNEADGFFVDGLQHRQGDKTTATAFMLPPTWTDPSQIYFNIYIYGKDSSKNTVINLEFHEADFDNPTIGSKKECGGASLNGFGHDPCTDDGWVYAVPLTFTGWKLISVKYSDFTRSVSIPNGGSGNKKQEPARVARIQVGAVASPAFKVVDAVFDYPVITYGGPFDPSK